MDSSQTHQEVFSKQHAIDKKLVIVVMITYILLGVVVLIG
jgi:hypothetical protein